jgi:hypothetical protein
MENELKLPEIVEQYYDYCTWVIPKISRFQKDQRYMLGNLMETKSLQILDLLIESALIKEPFQKKEKLYQANMNLQQLRYYFRIAGTIKLLNLKSVNYAAKLIDDVGKRIGLWQKSLS